MQKSRTLIIAIPVLIILLGLVIYQHGYMTIGAELEAVNEEKDLKLKLLNKYVSLINDRPFLEEELALLREERQTGSLKLIGASSILVATATLQKEVKEIILSSGGTISSERVKKTEDFEPFKIITVSIDAVLPDSGVLGDILYSIETRTPYFIVSELDARVRNYRVIARRKTPGNLTVKFDVSALTTGK